MVLTLLAAAVAMLALVGVLAGWLPATTVRIASLALCATAAVLALVGAGDPATLVLPLGPPDATLRLVLDPLAAHFLVLQLITLAVAEAAPLSLAGAALATLAGDGVSLAVGLLLLLRDVRRCGVAVLAAVSLLAALALAGAVGDLALLRTLPPDGWSAAVVLILVLAGAGMAARLDAVIALYLLLRLLYDLPGMAQPQWWGLPLLLAGGLGAVLAALRAAFASTLRAALSAVALHLCGAAAIAVGVAMLSRASDLPAFSARALAAAWLAIVGCALCRALFSRCSDAVEHGAGTGRLDRLGGLFNRMPVTGGCCLAGLFAAVALPPGLGFAALWLLFQGLLAAGRAGDFGAQVLIVGSVTLTGFAQALAALAAVRLFVVAFLGRPRSPRVAVAEEAPRTARLLLAALAGLVTLLGLLPWLVVLPARAWIGATAAVSPVLLRTGPEAAGYPPLGIAVLLVVAIVALHRALGHRREQRLELVWADGFAAPPPWLPFGDPATQHGPAAFVAPLERCRRQLIACLPTRRRLLRLRRSALRRVTALLP